MKGLKPSLPTPALPKHRKMPAKGFHEKVTKMLDGVEKRCMNFLLVRHFVPNYSALSWFAATLIFYVVLLLVMVSDGKDEQDKVLVSSQLPPHDEVSYSPEKLSKQEKRRRENQQKTVVSAIDASFVRQRKKHRYLLLRIQLCPWYCPTSFCHE